MAIFFVEVLTCSQLFCNLLLSKEGFFLKSIGALL
jgi:hypothetical protein